MMPSNSIVRSGNHLPAVTIIAMMVAIAGGALAAQDKYTVKDPNGLAFADFRGYESWQPVSVSQTPDLLKVMVANPTMIDAYQAGIPGTANLSLTDRRSRSTNTSSKRARRPRST